MAQTTKPRRKAANGTGSVLFDRGRQRWRAMLTVGFDATGKQRQRKSYHRTETDARAWLDGERAQLAGQQARGINAAELPKVRTVGQWLDWWTSKALPGTVGPTTLQTYRDVVRLYVTPHLGRVRLTDLQPAHVSNMLAALAAATTDAEGNVVPGKSPNTLRAARTVLGKALRRAESEGLVLRNAARLADAPRVPAPTGRTLTPDQARSLIASFTADRYGPAFLVALTLGLRRGEVLALRWSDVDSDRCTLSIARSLKRIDGRWTPEEAKTRGARRTLFVPPHVLAVLARWRSAQADEHRLAGPEWSTDLAHADLMFTTPFGGPVDGSNFRRYLHTAAKRAGLGAWTPHELRHSAASLMLAEGVPLKVVSETLGHSSVKVTADVYGHLLEPARLEASAAMSRALGLDVAPPA